MGVIPIVVEWDINEAFAKFKVPIKWIIGLIERAFKMMKNGVYFIVIVLLIAELFKVLIYAN